MSFDTLTLSRLQFALTIMFHYLFPPLSIGLGTLMVLMEGWYLRTKDPDYQAMTKFWTKIFAVNFAVGVATGIVMEFQFGTNWSRYSRFVGDVFGSALAAEGIFAFFLESGFLAVLVFGWDRVSPRMHFVATCMVALGSIFSAIWIVVANSWQHTPAGHHIVLHNGVPRAEILDFWAMVFNPSSVHRLLHVLLGSWILGGFFVMSVLAWYLLHKRHEQFARKGFGLALVFTAVMTLAMGGSGHFQARTVAHTQPEKMAALEGHFHAKDEGTAMCLVGWPNAKEERVDYGVFVPKLLSLLVHDDPDKPVRALNEFQREDWPPLVLPFMAYRVMLGAAGVQTLLVVLGLFFWWRGTLFEKRWLLWAFVAAVVAPYAANQAGWVAAEVGRQPWVVYRLLRTKDAFSTSVPAGEVLASILMFGVIYLLLFCVWVYVIHTKIQHGPDPADLAPERSSLEDVYDTAARRGEPSKYSLSSARDQDFN